MDMIPDYRRWFHSSGIFATANLANFLRVGKKYSPGDGICDSYSLFSYILRADKQLYIN